MRLKQELTFRVSAVVLAAGVAFFINEGAHGGSLKGSRRVRSSDSSINDARGVTRIRESDLRQIWLGHDEPLTVAKLKVLTDLAAREPRTAALVQNAMSRFGADSLEAFLPLFVADNPTLEISGNTFVRRGGETNYGELNTTSIPIRPEDRFSARDLSTVEPYRSLISGIARSNAAYDVWTMDRTAYLEVWTFSRPVISIARNQTLELTYESFIHELTHFVHYELTQEPDPLAFDDAASYEAAYLLSAGQEAEARLSGAQALIELLHGFPARNSLPVSLSSWFTKDGVLIAKDQEVLAVIRDELGYGARETYQNRLEVIVSENSSELAAIRQLQRSGETDSRFEGRARKLEYEVSLAKSRLAGLVGQ